MTKMKASTTSLLLGLSLLYTPLCAKPTIYEPLAMVTTVKKSSSDIEFWNYVKNEDSADYYEAYLRRYPEGIFVPIAKKKIAEMTQNEKDRAHIGLGGGIIGLEMWIAKHAFSYGFAIKSTATLKTVESAAFVDYHLNDDRNGAYVTVSFGYQYLQNPMGFTPGVGAGIGYRLVFLDLIYIDYGVKILTNRHYTTGSFHTFTGFEF